MFTSKKQSLKDIGLTLAEGYPSAFSADKFHSYFDSGSFAEGQTIDRALSEWHAFGTFTHTFCVWEIYGDQEKVFAILDVFQPAALKLMHLNEFSKKHFIDIVSKRQDEYLKLYVQTLHHLHQTKDSTGLLRFYGRVISRISGRFDPGLDTAGVPQLCDAGLAAAICHYSTGVIVSTKSLINGLATL